MACKIPGVAENIVPDAADKTKVSFFITSEGSIKPRIGPIVNPRTRVRTDGIIGHDGGTRVNFSGGNLGGIAGADAQCTRLAEATGLMGRTWKAFLYTSSGDAFDRIGSGPWFNIDEEKIADNVQSLKDQMSTAEFLALLKDEKGNNLVLREHDILIGNEANNCKDWTSEQPTDSCGITGHIDEVARDNRWILVSAHSSSCNIAPIVRNQV